MHGVGALGVGGKNGRLVKGAYRVLPQTVIMMTTSAEPHENSPGLGS